MKKLFPLVFSIVALNAYAQPKMINQAIITTKTTIVSPDEDESSMAPPPPGASGGDGEVRVMRFFGDGETKTTTWLKNDMYKVFSETETGRTTIIRDNNSKTTITIMEMMGRKFGIRASDEEQAQARRQLDSMMQARNATNTQQEPPKSEILYFEETKKIAGYQCNKAIIVTSRSNGKKDSSIVWYCPEFKLKGMSSTGGTLGGPGAFGGFGGASAVNVMDQLNGFPLEYERNMNRGRKMTVQVTKLVFDKEIADKEFEVPKDIELKSPKEMMSGGPGMFQMRRD